MNKLYVIEQKGVRYEQAINFVTAPSIANAHRTGARMFEFGKFRTRTPTPEEREFFEKSVRNTDKHYRGTSK